MIKPFDYKTRKDGVKLFRTYSDNNMHIRQVETGVEYSEAIDVENAQYTYEETDKAIEIDNHTSENALNSQVEE